MCSSLLLTAKKSYHTRVAAIAPVRIEKKRSFVLCSISMPDIGRVRTWVDSLRGHPAGVFPEPPNDADGVTMSIPERNGHVFKSLRFACAHGDGFDERLHLSTGG